MHFIRLCACSCLVLFNSWAWGSHTPGVRWDRSFSHRNSVSESQWETGVTSLTVSVNHYIDGSTSWDTSSKDKTEMLIWGYKHSCYCSLWYKSGYIWNRLLNWVKLLTNFDQLTAPVSQHLHFTATNDNGHECSSCLTVCAISGDMNPQKAI